MKNRILNTVVKSDTQQAGLPKQHGTEKLAQARPPACRHPPHQETRQMHSSNNKTPHRSTMRSGKLN